MTDKLVLYDLARKGCCACWSPNVWATRLVLNYKKIPYHTEWLSHPEIGAKLEAIGTPSNNDDKGSRYTLPTIQLEDGTPVMDSVVIASKLDSLYPEPALHLENGLHDKVGPIMGKVMFPLLPVFMPRIGRDVVVESSYDYFQETRGKRFGAPLDELERAKGGDGAWVAAQPGFADLRAFIAEHKKDDGPFVLGSQVSYVDFVLAAMIESMKRIGEDLYEKFIEGNEVMVDLHQACQPWLQDDQ